MHVKDMQIHVESLFVAQCLRSVSVLAQCENGHVYTRVKFFVSKQFFFFFGRRFHDVEAPS